ncbi:MAG: polyprenyl synthetase family protein [Gammaproteobacteria bacterium]|nr:polyprenyl synthetase family protein [Gammaproteobacteria bacterium]
MPADILLLALKAAASRVESALERALPAEPASSPLARLVEAMRYAALGPGKRVRPFLVYATGELTGTEATVLDAPACALELIHAYSLVHDDLPAIDDDDLRRGRPTCHRAFDEATAILVGDALQARAFELLAKAPGLTAETRLTMIATLARAAGHQGMVGGQAIDLAAVGQQRTLTELEQMHRLKTGALIETSVIFGALAGQANEAMRDALTRYARAIGLAFQVRDDILDVTANSQTLGKTQGKDAARDKPTYVSLLGLDPAQALAKELCDEALAALDGLPRAEPLRLLARYIVERPA